MFTELIRFPVALLEEANIKYYPEMYNRSGLSELELIDYGRRLAEKKQCSVEASMYAILLDSYLIELELERVITSNIRKDAVNEWIEASRIHPN